MKAEREKGVAGAIAEAVAEATAAGERQSDPMRQLGAVLELERPSITNLSSSSARARSKGRGAAAGAGALEGPFIGPSIITIRWA